MKLRTLPVSAIASITMFHAGYAAAQAWPARDGLPKYAQIIKTAGIKPE